MKEGSGKLLDRFFNRQSLLVWLSAAVLLLILLVHLGTQPGGLSPAEQAAAEKSGSFANITHNPVGAPHDFLGLAISKISTSLFFLRFSAALWAAVFAVCFYIVAKSWFGKFFGVIGAAVFVSTPLFLVAGRQVSADIMFAAPVVIMAVFVWLARSKTGKSKSFLFLMIASALLLYIPGMAWWLAGAAIIARRKLEQAFSSLSPAQFYLGSLVGLAIVAPLVAALISDWQLVKPLLLVPDHFSGPISEFKNIGWMAAAWFVKTPFHSPLIIERLPLLNLVQDVLLTFGLYAMFHAAKSKAWPLVGAIVFSMVAAGLNRNLSMLLLGLPAAALLMAAGLRFLYVEWRSVFPRNPAAKYTAILIVAVLGAVQLLFGVRYSLVAWPHNVATRNAYVLKYPNK